MYENQNIPITDRTRRIRTQYLEKPMTKCDPIPLCYGNYPLTIHWLEGFREAQHAPTTLIRRSCAEVAELGRSKVIVSYLDTNNLNIFKHGVCFLTHFERCA